MEVDPVIANSARKHDVADRDMLHAYRHPIRIFEFDEGFVMLIGADPIGRVYEVGVVQSTTAPVIVHAMPVRDKFLR